MNGPASGSTRRLLLYGKPGCHLCDDAHAVVEGVLAGGADAVLEERSILDDPAIEERYRDDIPVLLIDDRVHATWTVDPDRLRAALAGVPA